MNNFEKDILNLVKAIGTSILIIFIIVLIPKNVIKETSAEEIVITNKEINEEIENYFNEPISLDGTRELMEPSIYKEPIGKSILCSENKYMTYTNIDSVNINWEYIEVDKENLTYRNGVVREQPSGAILVAMGNEYTQGEYYEVHLSNNEIYLVKNIDLKANIHTNRTNCYTTYDNANSIIEPWVTDDFEYLWAGNSRQLDIYVEDIREPWYEIWGE